MPVNMKVLALVLVVGVLGEAAPSLKALTAKRRAGAEAGQVGFKVSARGTDAGQLLGPGDIQTDIIGGHTASDGELPWMVLITMDETYTCGGSLISPSYVLTAAQCTSRYFQFQIVVGEASAFDITNDLAEYAFTYKTIQHEDFQEDTLLNDIALLELLLPLKLNDNVVTINLPAPSDASKTFVGEKATVGGWGEFEAGYDAFSLKYTEQRVMDSSRCTRFFGEFEYIHQSVVQEKVHICGDGERKVGTCTDDAGGPLVIKTDDKTWMQIGISSFQSDVGCTYGYPSVYTRVTNYLDWINTNVVVTS